MLAQLNPDAVLFVGDLSNADIKLVKSIASIDIPTAVILGNHDRGQDLSGLQLKTQLSILGNKDVSWGKSISWIKPLVSVVGGRTCSAGGGYYLSKQVSSVYGQLTINDSVQRIVKAVNKIPLHLPLIILAHSGPTGLGSDFSSICGRDWKVPAIDWGDKDLEIAIDEIRKNREVDLVVFGHMHHNLKRGSGKRQTCIVDKKYKTIYLNAACVPRKILDISGNTLTHFSWVEFLNGKIVHVSHRWYRSDLSIANEEILYDVNISE